MSIEKRKKLIDTAIRKNMVYPPLARNRGIEGTVRLFVAIDREGKLLDCSLDRSSGSSILDSAAMKLIASVFPLVDEFPEPFSGVMQISYRLTD